MVHRPSSHSSHVAVKFDTFTPDWVDCRCYEVRTRGDGGLRHTVYAHLLLYGAGVTGVDAGYTRNGGRSGELARPRVLIQVSWDEYG